ncbi:MAG: HEAT repeat domain-containing protein [bacterium]|nr:HEAT repeat domain-containing protein [bacterium]
MDCRQFEELYWLRVYGESLPGDDESEYLGHLASCSHCGTRKAEFDRLHAVLTLRTPREAQPEALTQARTLLTARLRAQSASVRPNKRLAWKQHFSSWRFSFWQPAMALSLLAIGLFIGKVAFHTPANFTADPDATLQVQQQPVTLEHRFVSENVLNEAANISDLRIKPSTKQSGMVQVSFRAAKDYMLEGNPQDELIQKLLTWAVKNEGNSGARLKSVEGLASASHMSEQARQALAFALVNDKNDGVRLKALEALAKAPKDYLTEQAILGALLHDPNPAVRIRAVDALFADTTRDRSEAFLLGLAQADSNEYVRRRAAQAIRQSDFNYSVLDQKDK